MLHTGRLGMRGELPGITFRRVGAGCVMHNQMRYIVQLDDSDTYLECGIQDAVETLRALKSGELR